MLQKATYTVDWVSILVQWYDANMFSEGLQN